MLKLRTVSKTVAFVFVLMVFIFLVACGDKGGNDNLTEGNNGTGTSSSSNNDGNAKFSFTYTLEDKFIDWMNDSYWLEELNERTGTDLVLVNGGEGAQYYQNVDLRVGSGNFADAGIVTMAQAEVYGAQGAFLDLKPLIDEHAPNIKKFLDNDDELRNLVTNENGQIFMLVQEYPSISEVMFYRKDLLDNAGITELPTTIEEFTDVLRTLKAASDNPSTFYPYNGRQNFVELAQVFQANDHIDANGKVQGIYNNGWGSNIYAPGFREMIEWYIQVYEEGLIDPEWVAGVQTEESWQTKMLTGQGAFSQDFYTRPSWFILNGGPDNHPGYEIAVMPTFKNKHGELARLPMNPRFWAERAFVINAQAKDKAEGIIKYLDYMYSDEGTLLRTWGVEGVSYEAKDGKNEYILDFTEQRIKPLGEKRWNFLQDRLTFPIPVDNEAFYLWNHELTKSFANTYFDENSVSHPILKYTTEQLEQRSNLVARVNEEFNSGLVKFITKSRPMSEFDEFIAEMENLGYRDVIDIDQQAYDALMN